MSLTSSPSIAVNAEFPPALSCFFDFQSSRVQRSRYKVLWGGRGGAKSWNVARMLLLEGLSEPLRILCVREFQSSIADSVHKLLSDQIDRLNLHSVYTVEKNRIYAPNGTEFFFEGIKSNVSKIKSFEGIDRCWAEEAHGISDNSWNVLIPTIRKRGSEIWITFNPNLETDVTYQRFVANPPKSSIIKHLTWKDNPYIEQEMLDEMEDLKAKDYDSYLNVWEGQCKVSLDGAVYAKELRQAIQDGRITSVPYDRSTGVDTFWDLGRADKTAIWFAQIVGFEYHFIDYYEAAQEDINHYLEVLQEKHYIYRDTYLPHDAKAKQLASKRSIEEQLRAKGYRVRIVPRLTVADGHSAARTIFPNSWFDSKRCDVGLKALKAYHYGVIAGQLTSHPVHDDASHGADAFRYAGVSLRTPKEKKKLNLEGSTPKSPWAAGPLSWMGLA